MGFSPPQSELEGQSWKGAERSGAGSGRTLSCAYPAYVKCMLCSACLISNPLLHTIFLLILVSQALQCSGIGVLVSEAICASER